VHNGGMGSDNKVWQNAVFRPSPAPISQKCLTSQKQTFPRHFLNRQSSLGYHSLEFF
jgi:hypothetical protein